MLLDERALLNSFERSTAAKSIHHIVEQLARSRGSKGFVRIYRAIPRNHFPLCAGPARHTFRCRTRLAGTERSAVPSIVGFESENDLHGAPSFLDRFAAAATVQCRQQHRVRRCAAQRWDWSGRRRDNRSFRSCARSREHEPNRDAADASGQSSDDNAPSHNIFPTARPVVCNA
jgi:hypothetical protein